MTTAPGLGTVPTWTLTDRLRKAREHAGLDQATLASDIDISRNTVGNYEAGRVEPRKIVVRQWALRCGVSFEWIMTGAIDTISPDGPERWAPSGSNRRPTD